jgi:hypothetical protein
LNVTPAALMMAPLMILSLMTWPAVVKFSPPLHWVSVVPDGTPRLVAVGLDDAAGVTLFEAALAAL